MHELEGTTVLALFNCRVHLIKDMYRAKYHKMFQDPRWGTQHMSYTPNGKQMDTGTK